MSMLVTSVIPEVADRWDTLAFALHFKVTRVNIIKTNHPNNVEECCKEMFAHWLATDEEGTSRKTWEVLLNTLRNIDLIRAAGHIEMKLKQSQNIA